MPCYAATHAAYLPLFPSLPLHYIAKGSPQLLHSLSPSFHVPPYPMAEKGKANARSRSNDPDVGGPQVLTCLFVLGLQGVEGWAEAREGEIGGRGERRGRGVERMTFELFVRVKQDQNVLAAAREMAAPSSSDGPTVLVAALFT